MSESRKWSEGPRASNSKVIGIGVDYPSPRVRSEARGPAIALEVFLPQEDRQGRNYLSMEWFEATSWGAYVSPNNVDCRIEIVFGKQKLTIEGRNLHQEDGTISLLSALAQHRVEALWVWGRHYKDVDNLEVCITKVTLEMVVPDRPVYSLAAAG